MTHETEHEAFGRLIDSLKQAEYSAKRLAVLRSDRRFDKVASLFEDCRNAIYKLVETAQ
jgi:hypothetical protein